MVWVPSRANKIPIKKGDITMIAKPSLPLVATLIQQQMSEAKTPMEAVLWDIVLSLTKLLAGDEAEKAEAREHCAFMRDACEAMRAFTEARGKPA